MVTVFLFYCRSAFQCLQLVFTDFLPTIPYRCYPLCVDTASKFGSQRAELNVSLTAIGLLWNLSDYFFQNVSRLQVEGFGIEHQLTLAAILVKIVKYSEDLKSGHVREWSTLSDF